MTLIVAADFGTEGVRVGAFDAETARELGVAERPYHTAFLRSAWVEQDPDEWWAAFLAATNELLDTIGRRDVAAIGVDATSSTVVFTDRDGDPRRPAILWMDARAGVESRRTGRSAHPVMRYSGGEDAVEWLVPKAMWVAAHEPDCWAESDVVAEQLDFVNHRLTGRWVASRLNATCKWNYDPRGGGYLPELYAEFGIPELIDKVPAEVVPVGASLGEVTTEVVTALGLTTTPIVAQGGIDAHMAMLGGGTLHDGELLLIGGTSVVHLAHAEAPTFTPRIWGPYPDALIDGWWIVEGGQVSGGSILKWLVQDIFGLTRSEHGNLADEALKRAPSGLLAVDHWMGNRTPYRDPYLRGALVGLTLGHDRVDVYRACVESIALGTRNVVDAFAEASVDVGRVVVAGGIRRNPAWLQLTADALGMPLATTRNQNLSIVAGVVSAATALGLHADLVTASDHWVDVEDAVEPRPEEVHRLDDLFDEYRDTIASLAPQMHRLSEEGGEEHAGRA